MQRSSTMIEAQSSCRLILKRAYDILISIDAMKTLLGICYMKQVFRVLALVALLVMGGAPTQAAPGWFTCIVKATGPTDTGQVFVQLTHDAGSPAFTNKWFQADNSVEKEMLATALTAIAANMRLQVRTDPAVGGVPVILRMYVKP